MSMNGSGGWQRPVGFVCLVASVGVLVFQQQIGQILGVGVMALWLVLGGLGIWLLGIGREEP